MKIEQNDYRYILNFLQNFENKNCFWRNCVKKLRFQWSNQCDFHFECAFKRCRKIIKLKKFMCHGMWCEHSHACMHTLQAIEIDIFRVLINWINIIKEMVNALRIQMLDI